MAKRAKKNSSKNPNRLSVKMRQHIEALGLLEATYKDWCWNNGFVDSLDKSDTERANEAAHYQREMARNAAIDSVLRDPRKLIAHACANKMLPNELSRLKWSAFCQSVQHSNDRGKRRPQLQELLLTVNERADFLFEQIEVGGQIVHFVDALIELNGHRNQWIRPLKNWRPSKRNRKRQFASLLRHLLAKYQVPSFMDSAWFLREDGAGKYREWFIHIGSGQNIRTAKKLPFTLTKRMAHEFLFAPQTYNVLQALRWAEVHGIGGDRRLTEALLVTQIGETFEHQKFWRSVILFFINNAMLDRRHIGPIIDYLQFQKFTVQEVMVAPDAIERILPPQPNLTMQGRTPAALLRQVDEWHEELNRSSNVLGLSFPSSGYKSYKKQQGDDLWTIHELLTGTQLVEEGKKLNHCVATYAESCTQGYCSIWSMERSRNNKVHKQLTIEVQLHGMIVQVRGKNNRECTRTELDLIRQWATQAGLTIDNYVELIQ
ncbi:MAG: hypothetical protein GY927_09720 [bacterium]|nr:hypothetical protein [bacterium]